MSVKRVTVTVHEDDQFIGKIDMDYFDGQPYEVQLVTPDGVDGSIPDRKVGQYE